MIETDEDIQKGTQVLIDYGANFGFRMDVPSSYTKNDAENFCKTVTPAIFKLDYTDFEESPDEKEEEDAEEEAKLVKKSKNGKKKKHKKDKKEEDEKLNQEGGDKEEGKGKQQRKAVRKSTRKKTEQTYVESDPVDSSDSAEEAESEEEKECEEEEVITEEKGGGKEKAEKRQRAEDKDDKEQKKKDEDSEAAVAATAVEAPAKKRQKRIPKKIEVLVKFRDGDITLKDVEPGHLIKALVQTAAKKAKARSITVPKQKVLTAGPEPFNNNSILLSACQSTVEQVLMTPESAYFVGDKALQERKFLVHIFGLTEFTDMQKSSAAKNTVRGRGRGKARGTNLPR